jgi:mono/diheme cytochrome c family protein
MTWRSGLRYGLTALALIAAGFAAWVWFASEAHFTSFAAPPPFAHPIASDSATLARGERIAKTRGCFGCHGNKLQGDIFDDDPIMGRAVGANLAKLAHENSPAVFERALRHGIGSDGRALWSMPAYNFVHLSDSDVAALYAYARSLAVTDSKLPAGWLGVPRIAIAMGDDGAIPAFLGKVPPLTWQEHPDPAVRRGEYLAMTSCTECHGFGLRGDDPFAPPGKGAPDLALVASYDKADFTRLMRTGKGAGNRELRLMSRVARGRFVHWTDAEVDDLYTFLSAMGQAATVSQASSTAAPTSAATTTSGDSPQRNSASSASAINAISTHDPTLPVHSGS